jgi:hypothetical protein
MDPQSLAAWPYIVTQKHALQGLTAPLPVFRKSIWKTAGNVR